MQGLLELDGLPEGPSTQHVRLLIPESLEGMMSGTRDLKYWILGPFGSCMVSAGRIVQGSMREFRVRVGS